MSDVTRWKHDSLGHMTTQQDGDYVAYADHTRVVAGLETERDEWHRDASSHLQALVEKQAELNAAEAERDQLQARVTLGDKLVAILQNYCGEFGDNEGAVETLNRLLRERNEARERYKAALAPPAAPGEVEELDEITALRHTVERCKEALVWIAQNCDRRAAAKARFILREVGTLPANPQRGAAVDDGGRGA